jgi:hypothetical protein
MKIAVGSKYAILQGKIVPSFSALLSVEDARRWPPYDRRPVLKGVWSCEGLREPPSH